METADKRLTFLRQALAMQDQGAELDSEGWLRSDQVAAALQWPDTERAACFAGDATDLVTADLEPQGLVEVSMRLNRPHAEGYNYVFAVTDAGRALAQPPAAVVPTTG